MPQNADGLNLKQHFVAFLDLLGFTEMVEADLRGAHQNNLAKLFRCHQSAGVVFRDDVNCSIIQFSDSIVISMPYSAEKFEWFVSRVADYQRLLLDEHLLCRGGIAVNKHFSNGSFTFSAGLIEAYKVESRIARYPRVVVSPDVLDLIFPDRTDIPKHLVKEDDGLFFVDYIGLTKRRKPVLLTRTLGAVVSNLSLNTSPSVREKGLWLASYSDSVLATNLSSPRFTQAGRAAPRRAP
ncbi:hypothetical protein [Aquabacterium sp. CECT 9606]|uniref:hypothetical protein n=1 Tax=Aquabacterium sp. CECT 9606 TaxID=2845822 RepID=UPI001E5CB320|nr:hypothetical protein [Aquabacterium sp. CECT 9606]CAH0352505.1 hypothetical protein AQB9606_02672 [Aquabacterium sp. CECT 9606]